MTHKATYDIEVHEKDDEWSQATFLVHGYDDVLWTDDAKAASDFILESIEKEKKESIVKNKTIWVPPCRDPKILNNVEPGIIKQILFGSMGSPKLLSEMSFREDARLDLVDYKKDYVRKVMIEHVKYLRTRLNPKKEYDRWRKERIIGSSHPFASVMMREDFDKISFVSDMKMIWHEIHRMEGMIHGIMYFAGITEVELK